MDFDFSDLETTGFVVLKDVINSEEISRLLQDYIETESKINFVFSNKINEETGLPISSLKTTITDIVAQINSKTSLKPDWVYPSGIYLNNNLINLAWHQDHEIFYKTQDAFNTLNFWLPIIKPKRNQDGLKVIPHDVLINKFPEIAEDWILNKGAKLFQAKDNKTIIFDHDAGTQLIVDDDLFALSKEVDISVGDILIHRCDLVHGSATKVNNRLAISVRSINSKSIFNKSKFLNNCSFKEAIIKNNPLSYETILKKIADEPDRELFTLNELYSLGVL
jgi:ectoine hydroxylase-related dioxygenase (phytanoyl-CoA dioxygenase family)